MIVNIGFKINAIIIESLHYCVIGLLMVFSFCSCVTNSKVSNDEQISVMVDSLNVYKENKDGRAMILVLDSLKSFNINISEHLIDLGKRFSYEQIAALVTRYSA